MGLFNNKKKNQKYLSGLKKTRTGFIGKLKEIFSGHDKINSDLFEELTDTFIMADVGVETTLKFMEELEDDERVQGINNVFDLQPIIVDKMYETFYLNNKLDSSIHLNDNGLSVILFVGVNGVGKTITIAKLANKYKTEGKKVLLAAADTFRAGAIDQLEEWANRIGCDVYLNHDATDPSSVIFDAIKKAKDEHFDILLCDTAGRLQTKINLMNELAKMNRVIEREVPGGACETLLVIDATTGQNGLSQAEAFMDVSTVSGVVLTKLDGTSKGGIVLAIMDKHKIPIKFVGLGEKIDDLEEFNLEDYINSLFEEE